MKKCLITALALTAALNIAAQGANSGMGGDDSRFQSLAERIAKVEKKNDVFNVFIDYTAAASATEKGGTWDTRFANKELRLEVKGNLTDRIFYRMRHRLNRSNVAMGQDNFARATDMMLVGYNFSDKWTVIGGKTAQIWGGYEYDENPMFIYQYSDMLDYMDIFLAGAIVSFKPVPTQEFALEVSDAENGSLTETYGEGAVAVGRTGKCKSLQKSHHPLTYIANWNGNFFDSRLQTRWSYGLITLDKSHYAHMVFLGQKLNLPRLQCYLDYMRADQQLDRLGIASADLMGSFVPTQENAFFTDVLYNSLLVKANWQFAPKWNLMLKGMTDWASVKQVEPYKNYRTAYGYLVSLEYYPDVTQNFRVFLAYIGKKVDLTAKCGLKDYNTNRIELGFMYRIKCY